MTALNDITCMIECSDWSGICCLIGYEIMSDYSFSFAVLCFGSWSLRLTAMLNDLVLLCDDINPDTSAILAFVQLF